MTLWRKVLHSIVAVNDGHDDNDDLRSLGIRTEVTIKLLKA